MAAVVKERVDRFLQHPLFVANNDVGRFELEKILQSVVPIDDAAIQIIQIGSRESSALERNKRTQIRRNDGQHFKHHPFGTRVGGGESLHKLQSLRELLANLFALGVPHCRFELFVQFRELDFSEEFLDRFGAHSRSEIFAVLFLRFPIFHLGQQLRFR